MSEAMDQRGNSPLQDAQEATRPGFPEKLRSFNHVYRAMEYLASIHVKGGFGDKVKLWPAKNTENTTQKAFDFFNNDRDSINHWRGLFQMLKDARYEDRNEVERAADQYILGVVRAKELTLEEKETLGEIAHEALVEVYGK